MIPAITGVESNFGKRIPYNSYNAYGWGNGNFKLRSWNKYIEKGARRISHIAKTHAPPSQNWRNKVKNIINKIDPSGLAFAID